MGLPVGFHFEDIPNVLAGGLAVALILYLQFAFWHGLLRSRSLRRRAKDAYGLARAASEEPAPRRAAPNAARAGLQSRWSLAGRAAGATSSASAAMDAVQMDDEAMDACAILDVVWSERQLATWRVYRSLDQRDWVLFNIALAVLVFGGWALAALGAQLPGDLGVLMTLIGIVLPVLAILAIGLVAMGPPQFRRARLGQALTRRARVVILTPHGVVAGKPATGAVAFHLRYRDVVSMAREKVGVSGAEATAHHWLHVWFTDGSHTAWECWERSDAVAKGICAQIIQDWRAYNARG
jgi:hypothetical protein